MISTQVKFLLGLLLMVSLFFINGCAIVSHGRMARIEHSQVDTIQIGSSTKEDIIKLLGKPQQIMHKPDGTEAFIYIHGIERSIGIPWLISWGRGGGTGQTLSVVFDQYGTVIDYEYTTDERGLIE